MVGPVSTIFGVGWASLAAFGLPKTVGHRVRWTKAVGQKLARYARVSFSNFHFRLNIL
jgi:hypothetical protein